MAPYYLLSVKNILSAYKEYIGCYYPKFRCIFVNKVKISEGYLQETGRTASDSFVLNLTKRMKFVSYVIACNC